MTNPMLSVIMDYRKHNVRNAVFHQDMKRGKRHMDKFIAREKMSKKARKELDSARRAVWGISPVTRRAPDKKKYDRKKLSRADDGSG